LRERRLRLFLRRHVAGFNVAQHKFPDFAIGADGFDGFVFVEREIAFGFFVAVAIVTKLLQDWLNLLLKRIILRRERGRKDNR
jgi:hypothetical protein